MARVGGVLLEPCDLDRGLDDCNMPSSLQHLLFNTQLFYENRAAFVVGDGV